MNHCGELILVITLGVMTGKRKGEVAHAEVASAEVAHAEVLN